MVKNGIYVLKESLCTVYTSIRVYCRTVMFVTGEHIGNITHILWPGEIEKKTHLILV